MSDFIQQHQPAFAKVIDHLRDDLKSLRTGRAHPAMIDGVLVEAYDSKTPLQQLASITLEESRSLIVQPWDKSIVKNIEKSITQANLGLSVTAEGGEIRVTVPLMTEEKREEMLKILRQKLENAKISLRAVRDRVKEGIIKGEKDGDITED